METRKGEIKLLETKNGVSKTGNAYRRGEFTIGDFKYSTFDQKIIDGFKPGDYVQMEGEQQGPYWNMKTMKIVERDDGNGPVEAPVEKMGITKDDPQLPAAKANGKEFHLSPEEVKCRALESAIAYTKDIPDPELLKFADKFVEWIYGN
jgi:hypothetical protein